MAQECSLNEPLKWGPSSAGALAAHAASCIRKVAYFGTPDTKRTLNTSVCKPPSVYPEMTVINLHRLDALPQSPEPALDHLLHKTCATVVGP